jgi:hypothetical protein
VGIQSQVRAGPLYDGDGAALQLAPSLRRGVVDCLNGSDALAQRALVEAEQRVVDDSTEFAQELGIEAEPSAQLEGKGEHPLP